MGVGLELAPLPGEWRHRGPAPPKGWENRAGAPRGAGGYQSRGSISCHLERGGLCPLGDELPRATFHGTARCPRRAALGPAGQRRPPRAGRLRPAAPRPARSPPWLAARARRWLTAGGMLPRTPRPGGAGEGPEVGGGAPAPVLKAVSQEESVTGETRRRARHLDIGRKRARNPGGIRTRAARSPTLDPGPETHPLPKLRCHPRGRRPPQISRRRASKLWAPRNSGMAGVRLTGGAKGQSEGRGREAAGKQPARSGRICSSPTRAGAWDRGPRREADRRQMAHAGGGGDWPRLQGAPAAGCLS